MAGRTAPIELSCVSGHGAFHDFPSLAWFICLDLAPTSAVVSADDVLLGARETWSKAAEKHFSWFPLGLFLIVCSGFLGRCSLVKLYHLLSPSSSCVGNFLSTPPVSASGQGTGSSPELHIQRFYAFAGLETTFCFLLAHRLPRNRGRNRQLSPAAYSLVIKKDIFLKKALGWTRRLPLLRP